MGGLRSHATIVTYVWHEAMSSQADEKQHITGITTATATITAVIFPIIVCGIVIAVESYFKEIVTLHLQ